jgi:hypothetical protein
MIKATYVLVNLGIVPLLAAYDGFLSLMYNTPLPPLIRLDRELKRLHKISRELPQAKGPAIDSPHLRCSHPALHWATRRGWDYDRQSRPGVLAVCAIQGWILCLSGSVSFGGAVKPKGDSVPA